MPYLFRFSSFSVFCLALMLLARTAQAGSHSEWKSFCFELEGGPVWQSKNDVRIPGNSGTKFSFKDLVGSDPNASGRFIFDWRIREQHGLRLIAAPLRVTGTGVLNKRVSFADTNFEPDTSTTGKYKFDTYRLGYRYLFLNKKAWRFRIGATLLLRDAKIEIKQAGVKASDSNVGFVPLLNFSTEWAFTERWMAILDFEGLAGGPGRALDLALKVRYDLTEHWELGSGYRMLEGGADNNDVYNFAWFNYAFLTVGYRF